MATKINIAHPPVPARLTMPQALAVLVAAPITAIGFIIIGNKVGISGYLFCGFLFAFYWGGIKSARRIEFLPAVFGSIFGIGLAYLVFELPQAMTNGGLITALAILAVAVFASLIQFAPFIFNNALMLFLTIGTAPFFRRDADFIGSCEAILLIAVYMGGLLLLGGKLAQYRKAK